jgi:hypothetical protein
VALTPAHPGVVHLDGKTYLLNPGEWTSSEIEELRAPAPRRRWWLIGPIVVLLVAAFLGTSEWPVGVAMRSWMPEWLDAGVYWFVALLVSVVLASSIAPRRASRFPPSALREPRAMELHWLERSGIVADDASDWKNLWRLTRHLDVLGETYERASAARAGTPFDDKLESVEDAEAALRADLEKLDELVTAARVTFDRDAYRVGRGIP